MFTFFDSMDEITNSLVKLSRYHRAAYLVVDLAAECQGSGLILPAWVAYQDPVSHGRCGLPGLTRGLYNGCQSMPSTRASCAIVISPLMAA